MVQTRERIQAVVNSARRLNTSGTETSTNFTYQFNRSFARITEVLIQSIQFPFTFYAVNASNNQLRVNRGITKTIIIPPGNYTATSMIATLNVALNNATDPVTGYPYNGFNGESFAVTYSSISMKFTITNTNQFSIFASVNDVLSTMATSLGFQSSSAPNVLSAIGDSVANLSGPKYIRIESTFMSAPTQHKPLYADNSYSNTLFILPVNAGFGSFVSTDIQIPIRYTYKYMISNTDAIDFTVVDENGNELDLNGNDWSMYIVMVTE
jgi:hypothetical protein